MDLVRDPYILVWGPGFKKDRRKIKENTSQNHTIPKDNEEKTSKDDSKVEKNNSDKKPISKKNKTTKKVRKSSSSKKIDIVKIDETKTKKGNWLSNVVN